LHLAFLARFTPICNQPDGTQRKSDQGTSHSDALALFSKLYRKTSSNQAHLVNEDLMMATV
jgi:hypothetical protein